MQSVSSASVVDDASVNASGATRAEASTTVTWIWSSAAWCFATSGDDIRQDNAVPPAEKSQSNFGPWATYTKKKVMDELLRVLITAPHKLGKLEQERIIKAMVDKAEKAIILDQPDQIRFAQLCARKGALSLELKGLRRSRGQSAYAICKKAYGLKGSKQKVYEQLCELVERVLRGDGHFPL